jgi:hypothetical protein
MRTSFILAGIACSDACSLLRASRIRQSVLPGPLRFTTPISPLLNTAAFLRQCHVSIAVCLFNSSDNYFFFYNSFIYTLSPLLDYQYMYGIVYITLSVETEHDEAYSSKHSPL